MRASEWGCISKVHQVGAKMVDTNNQLAKTEIVQLGGKNTCHLEGNTVLYGWVNKTWELIQSLNQFLNKLVSHILPD